VRLLGAQLDMVTPSDVLRFADECAKAHRKGIVANHNAHSLALVRREPAMRDFYAMADIIEFDSTPLIAWGKAMGLPVSRRHRCTYLDWREEFWSLAQVKGWRVFHLGGAPGVAEAAAARIRARWSVALGAHHGYFDMSEGSPEAREVLDTINAFAPDILFVGLGMPLQERWIAQNFHRLERGVVFSVGGAFDYEAGVQATPPRWTGRLGLEWLFRLASQPRRLFARYCLEPWTLAPLALDDIRRAVRQRRRGGAWASGAAIARSGQAG